MRKRTRFTIGTAVAVVVTAIALSACGTGGAGATLSLVGFSTPKAANNAIEEQWAKTPEGQGVRWQESYGASGDQSRAVQNGLKADYVHFSIESDMTRLVNAGLVDKSWNAGPTKGIVSRSVVALAVRKGNPKHITGWADLLRPGISVITPNPGSSGSARWNILAAYGQALGPDGKDETAAKNYLTAFFQHVVALPSSGRDATTAFTSGTGDVLVTYENEAILARQSGQDLDYFVPDTTLRIDNPGAVLKKANPKAADWLRFVLGRTGQTEFAKKGFRPVIEGISVDVAGANDPKRPYPTPKHLLTIDDFGGWSAVNKKFFDQSSGLVTEIQRTAGK